MVEHQWDVTPDLGQSKDLSQYIGPIDMTNGYQNKQVQVEPDALTIQPNDIITVHLGGLGSHALPAMTLISADIHGVTGAYQEGEDGPVQVMLVPWGSIRFLSKTVEEG